MRQARGQSVQPSSGVEVEGAVVDFDKRLVTRDGVPIKLTPKEYDLLAVPSRNAGRVATHRQILALVWAPRITSTPSAKVFVGQLRAEIKRNSTTPTIVKTEPNLGNRAAKP